MRGKNAFTFVELLWAVGILLLLAIVLLPVYLSARRTAERSDCFSNMNRVMGSLFIYAGNNDDTLPMAYYPPGKTSTTFAWKGTTRAWPDLVLSRRDKRDAFECPSDRSAPTKGSRLSYALNEYFYRMPGGVSNLTETGGSLLEQEFAGSKILLAEVDSGAGLLTVRPDHAAGLTRHNGGANYAYADDHAEFHPMPEWWKTVPASVWEKPDDAQRQPSPQWFPWIADKAVKW